MKTYIAYTVFAIVIAVSVACVIFLPVSPEIRTYFSLPGLAGLFSLLAQGWRDQVAHERALQLQHRQLQFDLSIASHMADVVFDKQVQFCEEYSAELHSIMKKLSADGPTEKAYSYAQQLRSVRIKHAPWISMELSAMIRPFEQALTEIGALGMVVDRDPNEASRANRIDRMYSIYAKFLGVAMEGSAREPENAAEMVVARFSEVLNIFDFEVLRRRAIELTKHKTQSVEA